MTRSINILVTGGTGYIGGHLIPRLLDRRHRVRVLTRPQSAARIPAGATSVLGDALDTESVAAALEGIDALIHLVGTAHPTPSKADQFEKVDLVSIRAAVSAAKRRGTAHLIYVSVAQPAPIMQSYLWVRTLGECMIREAELTATILRPWYVLGPGRRWPLLLKPFYKLAELFPATRATAERLCLVTIEEMVQALVRAVEHPPMPGRRRIVEVPDIRANALHETAAGLP
ncbi:MAG: SDR family oxidoreductase [Chloroflexota bacterium]